MDLNKYLIIGGSTKCGTTSVFNYFEYHPQICRCSMKESRFFWRDAYPLSAAARTPSGVKNFDELFKNCLQGQVRLEATPDYLYDFNSAKAIHNSLPEAKLVFILRNPVSRLRSWFQFSIVNGLISKETSYEQYIQMHNDSGTGSKPQHLLALEHGKYSDYINHYIELFGNERVHITFYENLVKNPEAFCMEIANFAGISPTYFKNFEYKVFNQTVPTTSVEAHRLFRKFKRSIRPVTHLFNAAIRKKLKLAAHHIETAYQATNKSGADIDIIPSHVKNFLDNYYSEDQTKIRKIVNGNIPW